jgi:hypothetical protein
VNPFEMVVIIVFLSLIASVVSKWIKHRQPGPSRADAERLRRLEERVGVLERIVTDSGYEVRRQFRDLERES